MELDKEDRQVPAKQQQLKPQQVLALTFYQAYSQVLLGCKALSFKLKILRPR
jgi:hypothetical protein